MPRHIAYRSFLAAGSRICLGVQWKGPVMQSATRTSALRVFSSALRLHPRDLLGPRSGLELLLAASPAAAEHRGATRTWR